MKERKKNTTKLNILSHMKSCEHMILFLKQNRTTTNNFGDRWYTATVSLYFAYIFSRHVMLTPLNNRCKNNMNSFLLSRSRDSLSLIRSCHFEYSHIILSVSANRNVFMHYQCEWENFFFIVVFVVVAVCAWNIYIHFFFIRFGFVFVNNYIELNSRKGIRLRCILPVTWTASQILRLTFELIGI